MDIDNRTPYTHFEFRSVNPFGQMFYTCVLKAHYSLGDSGDLTLCEQDDLIMSDAYYGDSPSASLRIENDLAPHKGFADVYFIDPIAVAPGGQRTPWWFVSMDIDEDVNYRFRVTGPREWRKNVIGAWRLTEPAPTESVPVRYELSSGGRSEADASQACSCNPVGRGFFGKELPRGHDRIAAPQIEALGDPVDEVNRMCNPAGLTPVSRAWEPRRSFGGTSDDAWLAKKWPLAPDDFDYRLYNCAPRPLQLGRYLRGDEKVVISGLTPHTPVSFALSEPRAPSLLILAEGSKVLHTTLNLDTLTINLKAKQIHLTWRAAYLRPRQVRAAELSFGE